MDDSTNHSETLDIRYITHYKQLIMDILRELNAENFEQSIRFLKHIMIKIHQFQQLCSMDLPRKSYTEMIREVEDSYSLTEIKENEETDILQLFMDIHLFFVNKSSGNKSR
ncbi:hypothetical protein A5883_003648 [Enterococcus sp. 5B3_DIV0040]|nr:hypothetical protein A5883_003648 [Enterococcus sp. 5B3_DIV0040]